MEKYNEILSESLIDFEEIKFILANNNVELIDSLEIRQRYFLKNGISFKSSSISSILGNSYILENVDHKSYLSYKTLDERGSVKSKLQIMDDDACIEFLTHSGYQETFTIEKNIYIYKNSDYKLAVVNLIGGGLYLSFRKEGANEEELKTSLSSFGIPYKENKCDVNLERVAITKARRYLK